MIDRVAAGLLRRHVDRCAQRRALAGQLHRGGLGRAEIRRRRRVFLEHLGKTEVEDLRVPVVGQEDVLRLEIAVDDARLVSA